MQKIYREMTVPNAPQVYRLVEMTEQGEAIPTGRFRVRKRVKVLNNWTTHTKTFDNFLDAKRFARAEYTPPTIHVSRRENLFREVFERFMLFKERELKLARGTLTSLRDRYRHLKFFEVFEIETIDAKLIDRWIDLLFDPEYLKTQKSSRVNYRHEHSLLSNVIRYYRNFENENFVSPLLDRHRIRACAKDRAAKETRIRFLTEKQENEFLQALSEDQLFYDLALFQLDTGTRIGEAAAVEFRDVDFGRNEITIVQHVDWPRAKGKLIELKAGTKGGPVRIIPMTPGCREMLLRRKAQSQSSRVFVHEDGEWLQYRSIQHKYDKAFAKIVTDIRGTHSLRHTFAVRFLDKTKDINALKELLGHSSLKDTLRYAKYTSDSVKRSFTLFKGAGATEEAEIRQFVPRLVP